MDQISSITSGPRKTNIEILRIISMFLVLVVHADFWSLGEPTLSEFQTSTIPSLTRIVIQAIAIICVNVFIFISGWFTIKPSLKGFMNFIFQCGFFLIGIYLVMLMTGNTTLNFKGIAGCFCLTSANWFIRAYIALYILSPILNLFVEKSSKKQLGTLLVCFYAFQTIFGFTGVAEFVVHGYSTFSFIGLYLLAQYIRRYVSINYKLAGVIFITTVILDTFAYLVNYRIHIPVFSYDNPLVILGAASLFVYFNGLKIHHSDFINYIAKSSFAVFLLHTNPNIGEQFYKPLCQWIFNNYSGAGCLLVFLLALTAIFLLAVVLDYPRRLIWKTISRGNRFR
jgi:putative transmembrane protein